MMMDLKKFDVEQLKNLVTEINKELNKREKEEYKKAYQNVLSAIAVMAEKFTWHDEFNFDEYANWNDVYDEIKRNFEGI